MLKSYITAGVASSINKTCNVQTSCDYMEGVAPCVILLENIAVNVTTLCLFTECSVNPHNTVWGQFDPGGSFPCSAQKPLASQL